MASVAEDAMNNGCLG